MKKTGLARALSKLGYCSRSQAFELIRAGRVRVGAAVRRDPESAVDPERDIINVDGKRIQAAEPVYLVLNKPRGIVTTASDEKGRETVYSLLPPDLPWIAPVGRLDKASEGLLLLTNDSEWAARITDPGTHIEKTYHVQINGIASEELLAAWSKGVRDDGELLEVKRVSLLRSGTKNCWLEIVLDEGKNRHIRRMAMALGFEVLRLVRVSVGPIALGELPKGAYRELLPAQKSVLDSALGQSRALSVGKISDSGRARLQPRRASP